MVTKTLLTVAAILCATNLLLVAKPVVIWASDPVRAGESVVVRGDGFGDKASVEVSFSKNGKPSDWQSAEVLQQKSTTLKFVLPTEIGDGIVRFRISDGQESSDPSVLNAPKIWWIQGDETEAATPGGWLRLFGLNLNLFPGAKATIRSGDTTAVLAPEAIDEFAIRIPLPGDIMPGEYTVDFHNGLADGAAATTAGSIRVVARKPLPDQMFDVTEYGAVPAEPGYLQYTTAMLAQEQVDSADAVQKALDAAGQAGGGVVTFPRGIFVLSKGLNIPMHVTLRGAGSGLTALSYVDDLLPRVERKEKLYWGAKQVEPIKGAGLEPHPYLMRGEGHFTVEDLAIYAINHHAGIQSELQVNSPNAGHVTIRRVLMRLDRFVNNDRTDRHYSDAEDVFIKRWRANV
jgi:hypothetical protein